MKNLLFLFLASFLCLAATGPFPVPGGGGSVTNIPDPLNVTNLNAQNISLNGVTIQQTMANAINTNNTLLLPLSAPGGVGSFNGGSLTNVNWSYFTGTNNLIGWNTNIIDIVSTNPVFAGAWCRNSGSFAGGDLFYTNSTTPTTNRIDLIGGVFYLERVYNAGDGYYGSTVANDLRNWTLAWAGDNSTPVWSDTNLKGSWRRIYTNITVRNYVSDIQKNTNIIRVETWGNNSVAENTVHTTNSFPFATPSGAATYATNGDTIKIGPGYFLDHSFRTYNQVNLVGSGRGVTVLELHGTNFVTPDINNNYAATGPNFNADGFGIQSNLVVSDFTLTNSCIILASVGDLSPDGAIVRNIDIFNPGFNPSSIAGQLGYSGNGVTFDQIIGTTMFENINIISGYRGFSFNSGIVTNGTIIIKNCSVVCMPAINPTNMVALYFDSSPFMGFQVKFIGGYYTSFNGKTNNTVYESGTSLSRNTPLFFSHNSIGWNVSFVGTELAVGSTNAASAWMISESTSNVISGTVKVSLIDTTSGRSTNTFNQSFDVNKGDGSGYTNIGPSSLTGFSTNTFTIVNTNVVLSQLYTNNYGYPLIALGIQAVLTEAAVAGRSAITLSLSGVGTNAVASQLTAVGLLTTGASTNGLSAVSIPVSATYKWTDSSAGIGNSATIQGGQLVYLQQQTIAPVQTYKVYRANLTQTGTDSPVASIGENNLGAGVWTRASKDQYVFTLAGAFPNVSKVFLTPSAGRFSSLSVDAGTIGVVFGWIDSNSVQIYAGGAEDNNPLDTFPVTILVYP